MGVRVGVRVGIRVRVRVRNKNGPLSGKVWPGAMCLKNLAEAEVKPCEKEGGLQGKARQGKARQG